MGQNEVRDCRTCSGWSGTPPDCAWHYTDDLESDREYIRQLCRVDAWIDTVRARCGFDPATHYPRVEQRGEHGCPEWREGVV